MSDVQPTDVVRDRAEMAWFIYRDQQAREKPWANARRLARQMRKRDFIAGFMAAQTREDGPAVADPTPTPLSDADPNSLPVGTVLEVRHTDGRWALMFHQPDGRWSCALGPDAHTHLLAPNEAWRWPNAVAADRADERQRLSNAADLLIGFDIEIYDVPHGVDVPDDYERGMNDAGRFLAAALAQPADTEGA